MRKAHTEGTKLAAVFLARQSSVESAAEAFGIDPRTVRKWVDSVDLPGDQWGAIEAVLQARGAEMAAMGDTRGLVPTLTAAGIASRNVRYGQLIARREARREVEAAPPEPNPVQVQFDRLDAPRRRLMVAELHHQIIRGQVLGTDLLPAKSYVTDPTDLGALTASMVDDLLALTDDEVEARMAEIDAERLELDRLRLEADEAARPQPRGFDTAVDVTPSPKQLETAEAMRPQPKPESVPMVIDDGAGPNTWRPTGWGREF